MSSWILPHPFYQHGVTKTKQNREILAGIRNTEYYHLCRFKKVKSISGPNVKRVRNDVKIANIDVIFFIFHKAGKHFAFNCIK